jgi:hypothetical protein
MVDDLLATEDGKDTREVAWQILQAGQALGELDEVAGIIGRRFALRPEAVLEWYCWSLCERAKACMVQLDELKGLHAPEEGGSYGETTG